MAAPALLFLPGNSIEYLSFASTAEAGLFLHIGACIADLQLIISQLFLDTEYRLLQTNGYVHVNICTSFWLSKPFVVFVILIIRHEWILILLVLCLPLLMASFTSCKSIMLRLFLTSLLSS